MEETTGPTSKHRKFLRTYFYLLAISTAIILIQTDPITGSIKDILQSFFSLVGFIAFFGYIYDKRIFNHPTWLVLAPLFFVWEIGCYFFISNPLLINLLILLMSLPMYWSVALYPLITLESNDAKRLLIVRKKDSCVTRLKPIFFGFAILAILSQLFIFGVFIMGIWLKHTDSV